MRNTLKQRKQDGFTIIEVLIVLAIAGLIMLVVFLAVPALQRNQRNNARKAEASRISTLIGECVANKNGNAAQCNTAEKLGLAAGANNLDATNEYKEFRNLSYSAVSTTLPSKTEVIYQFASQCSNTDDAFVSASSRQFAVAYKTEAGGNAQTWACING